MYFFSTLGSDQNVFVEESHSQEKKSLSLDNVKIFSLMVQEGAVKMVKSYLYQSGHR